MSRRDTLSLNTHVKEAMTKEVVSFTSDTDIDKIALWFSNSNIRRVPIIDEGKLVGIISRKDIISCLSGHNLNNSNWFGLSGSGNWGNVFISS